jgi:hypothetical protein
LTRLSMYDTLFLGSGYQLKEDIRLIGMCV